MTVISSSLIKRLRNIKRRSAVDEEELCDFCGQPISADHRHMIRLNEMKLMCTCESCMIIQSVRGVYQLIPQRYLHLKEFIMSEELWSEFMIPVNMAFFISHSDRHNVVAYYPAAAGATESKLKMEPWKKVEKLNPIVKRMSPDVEALLVNRIESPAEYFIVPIDSCYKLVGAIRMSWKGIFGGRESENAIKEFFIDLKNKTGDA